MLTFEGRILQDNDRLSRYSIKENSVISLSESAFVSSKSAAVATGPKKTIKLKGEYVCCGGNPLETLIQYTSGAFTWSDILGALSNKLQILSDGNLPGYIRNVYNTGEVCFSQCIQQPD